MRWKSNSASFRQSGSCRRETDRWKRGHHSSVRFDLDTWTPRPTQRILNESDTSRRASSRCDNRKRFFGERLRFLAAQDSEGRQLSSGFLAVGKPAQPRRAMFSFWISVNVDGCHNALDAGARLGRIAGTGQTSTYANCLTVSGDSGGPLFDFEGRLIGVLDLSIGPELRHPGQWADIPRILDGTTFLTEYDIEEVVRLGFTNGNRRRSTRSVICQTSSSRNSSPRLVKQQSRFWLTVRSPSWGRSSIQMASC